MAYTVEQIAESEMELGVVGKVLARTYQVSDVTNTMGEPEVYKVFLKGQFNDGSVRYDVMVQRKDGNFAMLNPNKHASRCAQVFSALRKEMPEYKAANQAIRNR